MSKINEGLTLLNSEHFKLLLSYIIDAANTLTNDSIRKTNSFQLSSLSQLVELKSPKNKSLTLLHSLVQMLEQNSPKILDFVDKSCTIFTEAIKATANLQMFFPRILQKLWRLETESHKCSVSKETDIKKYRAKIEEFKTEVLHKADHLAKKLHQIDHQIVFFGNNENSRPPDSTVNDMKRLWVEVKDLKIVPATLCIKRAKRDEDRYTFFVSMENFLKDMKKARLFVSAKNAKDKQKEELAQILN